MDLATAPPSNSYLTAEQLNEPEKWYPLRVMVCEQCWLVQTEDFVFAEDMFCNDYAYFSSMSSSWVAHARQYVADVTSRFKLDQSSLVVEIAANDGYLLQFVKQRGIPCLGIEPTASTATAARAKGIETIDVFFGRRAAAELVVDGKRADLIIANNVLAHVPDINDFVRGGAELLKPNGVATFEFPHLLNLVAFNQFDTIYHEHFSYLSLSTVVRIFGQNGLFVFDVDELPTHGGSLRVFAERCDARSRGRSTAVVGLIERERRAGVETCDFYSSFQGRIEKIKNDLLSFLITQKGNGKMVAAYGAAAKGNTLLNFSGVRGDAIRFVVDRSPGKQGKFLPGSRVPIVGESQLRASRPDFVLILPWNIRDEIVSQLSYISEWGGRFVQAIPRLEIS